MDHDSQQEDSGRESGADFGPRGGFSGSRRHPRVRVSAGTIFAILQPLVDLQVKHRSLLETICFLVRTGSVVMSNRQISLVLRIMEDKLEFRDHGLADLASYRPVV